MRKIFTSISIALLLCLDAAAQKPLNASDLSSCLGEQYTESYVTGKMGMGTVTSEMKGSFTKNIEYKGVKLCFSDGELFCVEVTSSRYPMFKDSLDGGVKVGDPIGRIFRIREAYPKASSNFKNCYEVFTHNDWDRGFVFYDPESQKITRIKYTMID